MSETAPARPAARELVLPGEALEAKGLRPGAGVFSDGRQLYASVLGIRSVRNNALHIVPLVGRYIPVPGDEVIGKIIDVMSSSWLVDIHSPYPAPLHTDEVPWRVEFGETHKFMQVGDAILCRVASVDEVKRVRVTMQDYGLRKLQGGLLVEIPHSKVPRVIGKNGSMIGLLKTGTQCRIIVGQNGRIWLDGELDHVLLAVQAIRLIEAEAHRLGLTEKVKALLAAGPAPTPR